MTMQRGAAQIALRGERDITPVSIRCEPLGLSKGQPWWRVASEPLHFSITVGEDIPVARFLAASDGEPAMAARRLTEFLIDYFSNPRQSHASVRARNQEVADLGT
jgi:1-acyl-sn-glycerol-3-phosphate acyltransferase